MIKLITGALGKAAGGWLKTAVLPLALVALLTTAHQLYLSMQEARELKEARLVDRGRQQCISEVELATARAEVQIARQRAQAAVIEAEAAQRVNVEIQADAETLKAELDRIRNTVPVGDAERCLSDGVLELVRHGQGSSQEKGSAAGAKGGGQR